MIAMEGDTVNVVDLVKVREPAGERIEPPCFYRFGEEGFAVVGITISVETVPGLTDQEGVVSFRRTGHKRLKAKHTLKAKTRKGGKPFSCRGMIEQMCENVKRYYGITRRGD